MERPLATSPLVSVFATKKQTHRKHRRDGGITQLAAERVDWVGWRVVIGFMVMSVPVTPKKERRPPPVQECLGRGGTSQQIVAEMCGRCWAGVELSGGGGHPCKTGLWEAGRVEVKREQVFF